MTTINVNSSHGNKFIMINDERCCKCPAVALTVSCLEQDIDPRKSHMVKRSNLNAFATTRYHMPESAVAKEPEAPQVRELLLLLVLMSANSKLWSSLQSDARLEADLESRRLRELQREEDRRREEQLEKARVRGRQALRREQLEQVNLLS